MTHDLLTQNPSSFDRAPPPLILPDSLNLSPVPGVHKRVTIRIDDTMDIKLVLQTLTKNAGVNLVLNRDIEGVIMPRGDHWK